MSRQKTTEEFIKDATAIHGNMYDYSHVEYKNNYTDVSIVCSEHGIFKQRPDNHLRGYGCAYCSGNARFTKDDFIEKGKTIHGDRYGYGMVEYTNTRNKVKICCPVHGYFMQRPYSHLHGCGCPDCGYPHGWDYETWVNEGIVSKDFDSFKLYIIRCYDGNESFFKIGRTWYTVRSRFDDKYKMPYEYELIKVIKSDDGRSICELEKELQYACIDSLYEPKKEFKGMSECFSNVDEAITLCDNVAVGNASVVQESFCN